MLKVNWNKNKTLKNVEEMKPGTIFVFDGIVYLKCKPRIVGESTNVLCLMGDSKFKLCWFDDTKINIEIIENATLNIGED